MDSHTSAGTRTVLAAVAAAALLAGCAHRPPPKQFTPAAPFSKTFNGSGDTVCWSVKRALLSQGYMLEHANEGGVLTGSRDEQPKPKLNITTVSLPLAALRIHAMSGFVPVLNSLFAALTLRQVFSSRRVKS